MNKNLFFLLIIAFSCSSLIIKESNYQKSDKYEKILVWSEEFEYSGLPDKTKWNFETEGNAWGWGNGEDQFYTEGRLENARVENGILKITALEESMGGKKYTSARINTKGKAEFLYGRIEARLKLPKGRGIWPAFWMMPAYSYYGNWPNSGEIDIMEMFGWHNPDTAYFTIHTEKYNHKIGTHKQGFYKDSTIHDAFHIYAVEWFLDRLDFYFDDKKVFTYKKEANNPEVWPFDKPFYIILNNAVGGDWCRQNGGIKDTKFPQVLEIDYVRVYKFKKNGIVNLKILETEGGKVVADQKSVPSGERIKIKAIPDKEFKFAFWYGDIFSMKNELEITIFEDMTVIPKFIKTNEMIVNGDFSMGFVNWNYWVDNTLANATFRIIDRKLNVDVKKIGKYDWQVQLSHPIELITGKKYLLKFKAKTTSGKCQIRAGFNQNHEPWESYYSEKFELDKDYKEYSIYFEMKKPTDINSRIEFDVGNNIGKIIIEKVSVEEI